MKAKVRDYYKEICPEIGLIRIDTPINDIVKIISEHPASRSVYVIDHDGDLVGLISIKEILSIIGAKYLKKRTITVLHEILATTAADIMREAEAVSPDDTLEQALRIAVMYNLEDIPVVEGKKMAGCLGCFELIKGILEQHRTEQGGRYGKE